MSFFKRGQLIEFGCFFDGKWICQWSAIWHGNGVVHSLWKRKQDDWCMSGIIEGDKIVKIPHGHRIERYL